VTRQLAAAGLPTPELLPTVEGEPCLDLGAGEVWRVMSHVEGISFDMVSGPGQAGEAGALVGRFHRALAGLEHEFVGRRAGVHDTAKHLARLADAIASQHGHRLHAEAAGLGREILRRAQVLPPLLLGPRCIGHGDLKLNNILFAGGEAPECERAICLIDLDTVGPISLAHELGDAWRSWCNRSGEDAGDARFDLEVFRASLEGYLWGRQAPLTGDQRLALLLGPDWVSLELAARFAADALLESYFGWDPARFPGRGEHNLLRATGQWSLHQSLEGSRETRARLLGVGTVT
jgi:Ser/Thr protein kinase RdoA (MazF antagonist)